MIVASPITIEHHGEVKEIKIVRYTSIGITRSIYRHLNFTTRGDVAKR